MRSGALRRDPLLGRGLRAHARERRDLRERAPPAAERQAKLPELEEIPEAIAPQVQLALADTLTVVDRHLEAADVAIGESQDLDLLRKRHRVALRLHAQPRVAAADPHAGLGVDEHAAEDS